MPIGHSPPAKNTRSQTSADIHPLPDTELPTELTGIRKPRAIIPTVEDPLINIKEEKEKKAPFIKMAHSSQVISLRDALEVVPLFSGRNIPLGQFIEGCEEAKAMLPAESETSLVKLIRTRLTGEARRSGHGQSFNTINDVITFFEEIYAPSKTLLQLYGELGDVCQYSDEDVITYLNRVRDIGKQIADAYKLEHNGVIDEAYATQSGKDLTRYFVRGLKPDIRQGMGTVQNMKDARKKAIDLERDLADFDTLRRTTGRRERHEESNTNRVSGRPSRNHTERVNYVQTESITCQICKKHGHLANVCQYRFQQTLNQGNSRRWEVRQNTGGSWTNTPDSRRSQGSWEPRGWQPTVPTTSYQAENRRTWNQQLPPRQPPRQESGSRAPFQSQPPTTLNNTQQNTNESLMCRYCKNPGHVLEDCRKRIYNNTIRGQRNNQGNANGLPIQDVERETTNNVMARPVMTIAAEEETAGTSVELQ